LRDFLRLCKINPNTPHEISEQRPFRICRDMPKCSNVEAPEKTGVETGLGDISASPGRLWHVSYKAKQMRSS
jgi:hypothetical protein